MKEDVNVKKKRLYKGERRKRLINFYWVRRKERRFRGLGEGNKKKGADKGGRNEKEDDLFLLGVKEGRKENTKDEEDVFQLGEEGGR